MTQLHATASRWGSSRAPQRARALHQRHIALINPGWLCVIAAILLTLVGVTAISTTEPGYALKHIAHLCAGLIAAAVVAAPHYRALHRVSLPLLILVLLLLIFVLLPFVPDAIVHPRKGARRWINLRVFDFQPSEVAKIAYILALASYLRFRENHRRFFGLLLPLGLTFIPMGLILIEPDLGTAMLFLPTFFAMVIVAGAKLRHILIVLLVAVIAAPAMYPMLKDHQKARIHALYYQMTGDTRRESDIGYQGAKAMMLVGAGGMTGVGEEHAADLISFNHLPEEHNDMVFAVVVCRWGMLGGLGVISLFGLLTIGGFLSAAYCKDPFGRLVTVGIVSVLFAQMTINIGMTIGLMPITGMTLPFVSAGGTSLISTWMMVGIILSVAMRRPSHMTRKSFEFDEEGRRIG